MKEKTKAYLAGIVDAEGCLSISKKLLPNTAQYGAALIVTNQSRDLMNWLVKHFGGQFKKRTYLTRQSQKPSFRHDWIVYSGKHIEAVLLAILPHLTIKSRQAGVVLDYVRLNGGAGPDEREKLYRRARELKAVDFPFSDNVTTNTRSFVSRKDQRLLRPYAAGMLDGDGCIFIALNKRAHQRDTVVSGIHISSDHLPVLLKIRDVFGGRVRNAGVRCGKCRYQWTLSSAGEKERFVLAVLPYLIIKRKKAGILLDLLRISRSPAEYAERLAVLERMKKESDLTAQAVA